MSIGNDVVFAFPIVIEEKLQMGCLYVQYTVNEQVDEIGQLFFQLSVFPYSEQVSVWFQDMQMGVHRFTLVGVLVAETHISHFFPLTGQRLAISVFLLIEAVRLNVVKQTDCILQRFAVTRRTVIFA